MMLMFLLYAECRLDRSLLYKLAYERVNDFEISKGYQVSMSHASWIVKGHAQLCIQIRVSSIRASTRKPIKKVVTIRSSNSDSKQQYEIAHSSEI